jgi:hypothetical protein
VLALALGLLLILLAGILINPDDQKQPTGAPPTVVVAQPASP